MDSIINLGAVTYGIVLVATLFLRTPLTEALRIDTLFAPNAGEGSRPINAVLGVVIAGYGAWSLWLK